MENRNEKRLLKVLKGFFSQKKDINIFFILFLWIFIYIYIRVGTYAYILYVYQLIIFYRAVFYFNWLINLSIYNLLISIYVYKCFSKKINVLVLIYLNYLFGIYNYFFCLFPKPLLHFFFYRFPFKIQSCIKKTT